MRTSPLSILLGVALCATMIHCGSSDSEPVQSVGGAGGSAGDDAAAGNAGTTGNGGTAGTAGSGGSQGGSAGVEAGAEGGQEASTEGSVSDYSKTSATCGAILILGPQAPNVTADCQGCVNKECCNEAAICGGSPECVILRECYQTCTDDACISKCATDHPDGVTDNDAFVSCRNTTCPGECAAMGCVGSVVWNDPSATTYDLTITFVELQSSVGLSGLTVKVCKKSDTTCASPSTEGTTDAKGAVTLTVGASKEGIDSYFDITGTSIESHLLYITHTDNLTPFENGEFYAPLLSKSTASLLTSVMGVTPDATRGHVMFQATDCRGNALVGATVNVSTADASTVIAYMSGGIPSTTATGTDASAMGAVINIPPGNAAVTGKAKGATVNFGTIPVIVRAGYFTSTNLVPTP